MTGLTTGAPLLADVGDEAFPDADAFCARVRRDALFAPGEPIVVARAPGRFDVLGGIADYAGGLVLGLPIRAAAFAAAQAASDGQVDRRQRDPPLRNRGRRSSSSCRSPSSRAASRGETPGRPTCSGPSLCSGGRSGCRWPGCGFCSPPRCRRGRGSARPPRSRSRRSSRRAARSACRSSRGVSRCSGSAGSSCSPERPAASWIR